MKKLIALSVTVVLLLFGFATATKAGMSTYDGNITVGEDIRPWGNPRDISVDTQIA